MKLTRRQEEFITNLIDLSTEVNGPIHYSILAERLGVSPFTAYDMLCVLEEKGMVTSEYHLAEGKSGPGRAERLFCPAMSIAEQTQDIYKYNGLANLDKAELKKFMMEKIRRGDFPREDVARELLARIPPDESPEIRYCLEVTTVIALRLRARAGQQILLSYLPRILPADEADLQANLTLLCGFAFGLLVQEENTDHEWSRMLLEHVQEVQKIIIHMTTEEHKQLADKLVSVFSPLTQSQEIEMAIS